MSLRADQVLGGSTADQGDSLQLLLLHSAGLAYGLCDGRGVYFCPNCGIHTHFYGTYNNRTHYAYSIACLEGIDVESLPVEHIDGASF